MSKISRRDFMLCASALPLLRHWPVCAALPGKHQSVHETHRCEMISRWDSNLALEMPRPAASSWITPTECFYVFNHNNFPPLTADKSELKISGEVERPISLNWSTLRKLRQVEVINTLECAGNGRAFFKPAVEGVQWAIGAVGTAIFRGPRLAEALAAAKIKNTARHVAFVGADAGQQFVRSIPLAKALDADTILAATMNGEPLSPEHGYPVRVLVPGWIGAASVKRVTEIQLLTGEAQGEMMQTFYRVPDPEHPSKSLAVTALQVKSIITSPVDGSIVGQAPVLVEGMAWTGEATVTKVEVSTDSGKNWQSANIANARGRYAWRSWQYSWRPANAGTFSIAVRATDSGGNVQPQTSAWNPRGYLWNGIDAIQIAVEH